MRLDLRRRRDETLKLAGLHGQARPATRGRASSRDADTIGSQSRQACNSVSSAGQPLRQRSVSAGEVARVHEEAVVVDHLTADDSLQGTSGTLDQICRARP
jgi:hypothetical protein